MRRWLVLTLASLGITGAAAPAYAAANLVCRQENCGRVCTDDDITGHGCGPLQCDTICRQQDGGGGTETGGGNSGRGGVTGGNNGGNGGADDPLKQCLDRADNDLNQCTQRSQTEYDNCVTQDTLNAWQYCKGLPAYHVGVSSLSEDQRHNGVPLNGIAGCGDPPRGQDKESWDRYDGCLERVADQMSAWNARMCADQMINGRQPDDVHSDQTFGAAPTISIYAQCNNEKRGRLMQCRSQHDSAVANCQSRYGS
jgi:hypothetical protein